MELHAKCTVFAEGCRGHLSQQVMKKVKLKLKMDSNLIFGSLLMYFVFSMI